MGRNSESQKSNKTLKVPPRQGLGKCVSHHLLIRHEVHVNLVSLMQVTDVVVDNIYVL